MNAAVATVLGAVAGGGFAVVVAVVNAWFGRNGRRADVADKISEASDRIFTRLDKDLEKVEKRAEKCEVRLAATERRVADAEDDSRRLKAALRALIRVIDTRDQDAIDSAIKAAKELI